MIDDADDAGIDRRLGRIERKARLLAADEKDFFADTGADRVDGDERPAGRLRDRGQRLDEEQLDAGQVARPSCVMTTSPITRVAS